ncbi:hypothetical protein OI76_15655 [Listeria monocytogenes]|nr:hypothetical protein OI76_15655 [Listeria monocytogenes]
MDLELRLEVAAEVAPMDRVGIGRQVMVPCRDRHLPGQRHAAGRQGGNPALGGEGAGQERTALARHVLDELPVMDLEVGAGRIVASAHRVNASPKDRSRPWRRAPGR